MSRRTITIPLPPSATFEWYDEEDGTGLASVHIGDAMFHLMAIPVRDGDTDEDAQVGTDLLSNERLDDAFRLDDVARFETTKLPFTEGDYVLIMHPFEG